MPYDDPTLKEFAGYFAAKEPGRRERADAWATAIGLQKVDGLSPSRLLKDEREFDYGGKSPDRIIPHFARIIAQIWQVHPFVEGNLLLGEQNELKSRYLLIGIGRKPPRFKAKSGKKTSERVLELMAANPSISFEGMVSAIQV